MKRSLTASPPSSPDRNPRQLELELAALWLTIHDKIGLSGSTRIMASHCCPALSAAQSEGAIHWRFSLDPDFEHLLNDFDRRALAAALQEFEGQPVELVVEVERPRYTTPAALLVLRETEQLRRLIHIERKFDQAKAALELVIEAAAGTESQRRAAIAQAQAFLAALDRDEHPEA